VVRVLAFIEALGVTGAARNLFDTASAVDLRLATYRRRSAPPDHQRGVDTFVAAARRHGIEVLEIPERHAWDPGVCGAAARMIQLVQPDVVQTHNIKSHAVVALARLREPFRWIAFHHGYTDNDFKMRVYNRIDRWVLPRADAVVTPCLAFAHELASRSVRPERIFTVHNALAPSASIDRKTARKTLDLERATSVVVAVGRLSHEKGHDVLIDACARLDARADLTVVIAGSGPERNALELRARRAGIRLRLDGFRPDVSLYYAAADVFVLPSRSEGSPNALLEAMSHGCAIVATRAGGIPEIVRHQETASLVAVDDVDALRSAIGDLLASPHRRSAMGAAAKRAVARFTPAGRTAAILDVYDRILQDPAARFAWAPQ
jgi:glycosyltransferase involved in cell wall biosynthesis